MQAVLAADLGRCLVRDRREKRLELESQWLGAIDDIAHQGALADRGQQGQWRLGGGRGAVLVEREVLRQVVEVDHPALAEYRQLADLGRAEPRWPHSARGAGGR